MRVQCDFCVVVPCFVMSRALEEERRLGASGDSGLQLDAGTPVDERRAARRKEKLIARCRPSLHR